MPATQIFEMAPSEAWSGWLGLIMGAVVVLVLAVAVLVIWGSHAARHATFEITDQNLRIRGGMYGRTIPLADLELDMAKVLDLSHKDGPRLSSRRNGISLPGLRAGWFRLSWPDTGLGKTKEKVLAFVSNKKQVAYIPTTNDYSLLLSPTDPMGLITALRQAVGL